MRDWLEWNVFSFPSYIHEWSTILLKLLMIWSPKSYLEFVKSSSFHLNFIWLNFISIFGIFPSNFIIWRKMLYDCCSIDWHLNTTSCNYWKFIFVFDRRFEKASNYNWKIIGWNVFMRFFARPIKVKIDCFIIFRSFFKSFIGEITNADSITWTFFFIIGVSITPRFIFVRIRFWGLFIFLFHSFNLLLEFINFFYIFFK